MTPQSKALEENPALKQYFDSLPPFIQETIMQSGVCIENEEQLRQCARQLTQKEF